MIGNLLYGEPINWRIKVGSDSKNSVELGSGFKDLIYNRNSAGALNIILDSENYSVNFSCNQEDGFLDQQLMI